MTRAPFGSQVRRRPIKVANPHTPLIRQWQLLKWLSSEPKGVTVGEAVKATGTSEKTVRRDLAVLRNVGFELTATVEGYGRKRWRIRQHSERLRSKKQRYQAIRDGLDLLLTQAEKLGDKRLLNDLAAIRQRVVNRYPT
jgi:predicted DNA-binding transcriptional regulator YafY